MIEELKSMGPEKFVYSACLLYTSDAADDMQCVDLGGRRIIKKSISARRCTWETD